MVDRVGELFRVEFKPGNADGRTDLYVYLSEYLDERGLFPGDQIYMISKNDASKNADQDIFDCLSDAMSELCPPNHYFGEARYDTGVFGFWPVPKEYPFVEV